MKTNIIALVGRPNVGKSTLFNRLSIRDKAIVHNTAGVTRDRKYAKARLAGDEFIVVDTPGLEEATEGKLEERMMIQTLEAIKEADLVCLIIDARLGVTPEDKFFANFIRKNTDNFIIIANKCEKELQLTKEYFSLNGKAPVSISAEHNLGMIDLYEAIKDNLSSKIQATTNKVDEKSLHLAVVGRPNAGKSTFINSIVGSERLLVGPEAGITREAIEIKWQYNNYTLSLVDTAGLRKKHVIKDALEKLSAGDSINAINYANIVILMIDATLGLEHQDLTIANYTIDEGRGLLIAVNKCDLVPDLEKYKKEFIEHFAFKFPHIKDFPVIFLSALKANNLNLVLDNAIEVYKMWNVKIPTNKLNNWLSRVSEDHPLPLQVNGKRVRIKYMNQIKSRPPTFQLFTSDPSKIPESYLRYLSNNMKDTFNLIGIPLRFNFRKAKNPYVN